MTILESVQTQKIRLAWSLRGKLEVGPVQFVGQNALGLPYVQSYLINHSARTLRLHVVVHVLNELHKPIFTGSPGILETFDIEAQQRRTFRISLRDIRTGGQFDRQRLWATRSGVEIVIKS
ncbi:MAG: hypothetical protein HC828_00790 [Blastochloris sp.]|nr:hypothetical protein [Blastochloris sp.]